jgi:ATP-dependent RNA circularization protein (DNA/RNA ligase family)
MKEYLKIETIYKRDMEGSKKLLDGIFRNPAVDFLKDNQWIWTEKVDGTNIRVHWDGHKVEFGGRTDKAQIPALLVNKLNEYFGGETNAQLFEQTFGEKEVILFGEGYGAKIQSGGDYTEDGKSVDFIMFDVMIGDNYQPQSTVHEIAKIFGVECVPIVGTGALEDAVRYVKEHNPSALGQMTHEMEGIVCRPAVELQDRCGNRLIVKIKWEDFKHLV